MALIARLGSWSARPVKDGARTSPLRFATINGLPGVIIDGPEGPVQTTAFEIDGDVLQGAVRRTQSGQIASSGGSRRERIVRTPARGGNMADTC